MKKLSFINKIMFLLNNIVAILLVASFFVPNIKPTSFSIAPIIGLAIPALILTNILFILYWILLGFKKQFLLSVIVLVLGYFVSTPIYKFSSKNETKNDNELKIMSYNVRKLNHEKWIDDSSIPTKISSFIHKEAPDIVALQEFRGNENFSLNYPYHYNPRIGKRTTSGLAIFSKYPILARGKVKFKKHTDRIIYVDILKEKDTLRIYNFHLQSLGLVPEEDYLGYKSSDRLMKRLRYAFKQQEEQIQPFFEKKQENYKTIAIGDLNNTAYSWVYKHLKGNLKDTYLQAGTGFGETYNFKGFPLRIDYILVDTHVTIQQHKNYKVKYSDHYPIMAVIAL